MKIGDAIVIPTGEFAGQEGEVIEILPKVTIVIPNNNTKLRVNVPNDVLAAAEKAEKMAEAELLGESRQRISSKANKEATTEGSRGSREKNRRDKQGPPTPKAVATPETIVVKKEEKVKTGNQPETQSGTAQPARATRIINGREMESCPICGGTKPVEVTPANGKPYRPLTCKACFDQYDVYAKDVAKKLAGGEEVVIKSRHELILDQLDLARFGQELGEAFKEKERLNGLVEAELKSKGHLHLPREVFTSLRDTLQEKIYPEEKVTAKAAYGKWRRLQERLKAATEVRPQVEKMVAEEAARNAAAAVAQTETPPPAKVTKTPRKRTPRATTAEGATTRKKVASKAATKAK